jgi:hypothetical protein
MVVLSRQLLLIWFVLMSLSGCTTNPYTGRWQFVPFPSSYMMGLGAQSYAEVVNNPNVKISKNPQEVEPVQQVAERIIEMAKQSKYAEKAKAFQWEVHLHYRAERLRSTRASFPSPKTPLAWQRSLVMKWCMPLPNMEPSVWGRGCWHRLG